MPDSSNVPGTNLDRPPQIQPTSSPCDFNMDTLCWEDLAADRSKWRSNIVRSLKSGELELAVASNE